MADGRMVGWSTALRGLVAAADDRTDAPGAGLAGDLMFAETDTEVSPWYVVNSDNKKRARLNCIAHLLSRVPYRDLRPVEIELPRRQADTGYKRPKMTDQRFVPDIY